MSDEPWTLTSALAAASPDTRVVFHLSAGPVPVTAGDLGPAARAGAGLLRTQGVGRADAVGLLGPNEPAWARWAFSIWAAGATLVPLPFPMRVRDPAALEEQIRSFVEAADVHAVVAAPRFLPLLRDVTGIDWTGEGREDSGPPAEADPDEAAVIQFTSGSTSDPKGVVLTHRAVLSAIRAGGAALRLTPGADRLLGWQPFFHDNGLFGYLVRPFVLGVEGHVLPTARFAHDPAEWFRVATAVRATMTAGPSSAWAIALGAALRDPGGIDLGPLRIATLTAEAIDPAVVERLAGAGEALGLRRSSVAGAYGLGEATIGVTYTEPGSGLRVDSVDRERLGAEGRAVVASASGARQIPSSGRPVPGMELRVVDAGIAVEDRTVGEIYLRSEGLLRGYVDGTDPRVDGWLPTGDLGYLDRGELFVTGRSKEVVIVLGANHAPEDIEWAAERAPGVRTGRCVAFAGPEAEGEGVLVVVVEPAEEPAAEDLPRLVRRAIIDAIGITPAKVLVVPRGSIPKTTSGKPRRAALRDAYARGAL